MSLEEGADEMEVLEDAEDRAGRSTKLNLDEVLVVSGLMQTGERALRKSR